MSENEIQLQIGDVALMLGRVAHTVRGWERDGRLPEELRSKRDDRGWRYWTPEQVEGIKQWIIDNDIRPGKGLRKHLEQQDGR